MAASIARKRRPIYICEMMERLSIEPGGGVISRLGLSYATAFHRCKSSRPNKPAATGSTVCRRRWCSPRASARMPTSSLNCRLINLARGLITRAVEVDYHAHKTDDLAQWRRVLSARYGRRLGWLLAEADGSMADQYDVIVIGAGLGGLTAAALIARSGRKTLVVERNKSVGGAASTYNSATWWSKPLSTKPAILSIQSIPSTPSLRASASWTPSNGCRRG